MDFNQPYDGSDDVEMTGSGRQAERPINGPQPKTPAWTPADVSLSIDTATTDHIFNVASLLKRLARVQPHKKAVICPFGRDRCGRVAYTHLTFQQLDQESDHLAWGLESVGITRGTRTILMVKPSLDFFTLTFALFKAGAVPVVVDPGMGIRRMVECFKQSSPSAFIGIPAAHVLRILFPRFFGSIKTWVTVGRRWLPGQHSLKVLGRVRRSPFPAAQTSRDETAAVLFTTGSTGPAKGALYTHGIFAAQIAAIKSHFLISTGEIDLPTFPLFALFDPALGMTAVIPDMDPTRPAQVDPMKIIAAVNDHGVTNMFASPALLHRVGRYGRQNNVKLASLKRVISAGAPIMPANIEQFAGLLEEEADIHTGYGATEAMPVAAIEGREILNQTRVESERGCGICVGRPLSGVAVRIIAIDDGPIDTWSDVVAAEKGAVGEITVKGDQVTRHYVENPAADALSKIRDKDGIWHRMGDLGRLDEDGRIWFYGRKSHRVVTGGGTLFTIPCEAIFNNHPLVYRSALVGVGAAPNQKPVICIEPEPGQGGGNRMKLIRELLELASSSELTRAIDTVLFPEEFPVDIRHNAKIYREKLALWAAKKIAGKSP
jgi:acyl-CoA synthetase (AMP-forming)/AMP-acid ligase II